MDILFKQADTNGDGEIDFEEFSCILKKNHLEQFFSRKEQRDAFSAIDEDHSGTVSMDELVHFLTHEPEGGYAPDGSALPTVVKARDNPHERRSKGSKGGDANPLELQPAPADDSDDDDDNDDSSSTVAARKLTAGAANEEEQEGRSADLEALAEMERAREHIVEKLVKRRRRDKNEDGHGCDAQFVMAAFKQADEDQSGTLSRSELKRTFGPTWLNLGVSDKELDLFIGAADVDNDGAIGYTVR